MIKTILKQMFTEQDNKTLDLTKILATVAILNSWIFQAYALYNGQVFDVERFCTGQGIIFAGVGVALGLKKETTT